MSKKYPELTLEVKTQLNDFISKHPTMLPKEISKQFQGIPPLQIGGLRNSLFRKAKGIDPFKKNKPAKVEQEVAPKPEIKERPNPGGDKMALEKKDVEAIVEGVTTTIEKLRQVERQAEGAQEEKKAIKGALTSIPELKERIAKIPEDLCTTFPELCKDVQGVKTQLAALAEELKKKPEPPKPEPSKPEPLKEEKIPGTDHANIEELLSCPECVIGHIKKVGFDKAATEICKNDEACEATVMELAKKGYKIEKPKKEDIIDADGKPKGEKDKPEEGTEKKGHFTLGKG